MSWLPHRRHPTLPPRLARRLLGCAIPLDAQDAVVGDLDEEFAERILPHQGARRARRWYWRQTFSLIGAFVMSRLRSAAFDHRSRQRTDTMRHDLKDALRTLVRSPGYSLITIAVLALGIGSTSAIFSFVDGVLLRPLPYDEPDRIVRVWEQPPNVPGGRNSISTDNFRDWQQQSEVFDVLAAYANSSSTITGAGEPMTVRAMRVSAGYFDAFGAQPAFGRTFGPGEDEIGKENVAVITHRLWRSTFESDAGIIGRAVSLDRQPFTIIGVLPAGSAFERGPVDLFRPLAFRPQEHSRNYHWLGSVGRLKRGVTIEEARARMDPLAKRLSRDYPDSNKGWGITIERFADVTVAAPLRQSLRVLMAAVSMLLLVGCANLANLALARGMSREREVLVRAALGASRGRIVRQFLTESLLLSLAGGTLGLGLAYAMMRGLQMLLPPLFLPREALVAIDGRALGFALAISILTGLIFGTIPALQAGHTDLAGSMKGSSRSVTSDRVRRRLRDSLVVVEVALACTLLVGSTVLMRSFMRLQQVQAASDPGTLLTAMLRTANTRFANPDEARSFYRQLLERIAAVPGVKDVALTTSVPMRGWGYGMPFKIGGRAPSDPTSRGGAGFKMVSPSYFQIVGLPIVEGRALQPEDSASSVRVAVVNQAFAERYLKGSERLGQHVLVEELIPGRTQLGPQVPWQVVGVAANERVGALNADDSAGIYVPIDQSPFYGPAMIIRTSSGSSSVTATSLKAAIHEIDPNQPLSEVRTLAEIKSESVAPDRLRTWLIALFGSIAALLAGIGIYGVISYSVAQRTHEIGVRAALGANRLRLIGLVMRRATLLTIAGLTLGIGGAIWSARLLETLLFGIAPRDTLSMVAAATTLGLIATFAAWVPARRAAKVDPLVALRVE